MFLNLLIILQIILEALQFCHLTIHFYLLLLFILPEASLNYHPEQILKSKYIYKPQYERKLKRQQLKICKNDVFSKFLQLQNNGLLLNSLLQGQTLSREMQIDANDTEH